VPDDFRPASAALAAGNRERARALVCDEMLRIGIAGTPDEVVARCSGLLESGATHLSFGPPLGPDPLRAVSLLGEWVLPRLRDPLAP
jgi:5,10-methylenetetrahydromethanopterin reductase